MSRLALLAFLLSPSLIWSESSQMEVAKAYWLAWADLDSEKVSGLVVSDMKSRSALGVNMVREKMKIDPAFKARIEKRFGKLKDTLNKAQCSVFPESTICFLPGVYDTNVRLVNVAGEWKVDSSTARQDSDPNWSKIPKTKDSD